jgi:hypothetical protein
MKAHPIHGNHSTKSSGYVFYLKQFHVLPACCGWWVFSNLTPTR